MPASQSTSTQLDVINEAVRNIGDRPFELEEEDTNFRNQCRFAVKTALFNFERDFDWQFMRRYTNALSWSGNEATLPDYTRLSEVSYVTNNGSYLLSELFLEQYRRHVQFVTVSPLARPMYYAQQDAESILVTPAPSTVDEQNKVFFTYYAALKRPESDTDTFDIPENFIPLFVLKLAVELSIVHLSDQDSIAPLRAQYEESKRLAISRSQNISLRKANMYRGGRNGFNRR